MRFICSWQPGGAKTFRNRSNKLFDIYGRNLQNFSEAEKKVCKPKKGKIFIQRDISGAEAVIVGFLCRPGPYRDLSIYAVKHHSYIAAHLYRGDWKKETNFNVDHLLGLDIKELSLHPQWKEFAKIIKATDALEGKARRYYIGKKTGLSYNYCEGPDTFRLTILKESEGKVVLTHTEAELFRKLYLDLLFPEIPEWQQRVEEQVRRTRLINNLFGFPFTVTSDLTNKVIRECIAWIAQSTIGVLGTNWFVEMQEWSEQHKSCGMDCLNNVHDSLVVQCNEEAADEVDKAMGDYIESIEFESPFDGSKFRLKTESSRGYNLAKRVEIKNPDGSITVENPEGLQEVK